MNNLFLNFFTTKMIENDSSLKKRFLAIIAGNKKMTVGVVTVLISIVAAVVVSAGVLLSSVDAPEGLHTEDAEAQALTYEEKADIMAQIKGNKLEEGLGESESDKAEIPEISLSIPCNGEYLSASFNEERGHMGIDIIAESGTEVYSATDGRVIDSGFDFQKGNYIVITTDDGTIQTEYRHLSEILTEKDIKVKSGELIGKVGKTGMSTGAHLHFEIKVNGVYFNPETVLEKIGFRYRKP